MQKLFQLLQKNNHSTWDLWLLNRVMNHAVPFNKPHGFKITRITEDNVQTCAPYRKKNFNHVRGIHACAIATVGELSAGLILMRHFSPKNYRVIMSKIDIDYHYQAKKNIIATATLTLQEKSHVLDQLSQSEKILQTVITEIKDEAQAHIATVRSTWQIKSWHSVKTKI